MRTSIFLLLPFMAGCAQAPIDPATSQQVITSITDVEPHRDWQLGMDAFASETGGAAVRQSSVEHVVTRKPHAAAGTLADASGFVTLPLAEADAALAQPGFQPSGDEIERAWRKYCRHKLDMTDRDQEIIRTTTMPARLKASCNPKSLKK
ncbi:hypothetical protein QLH52_05635 [Methylomonas sp. OY6]|uniref:Uncharacterized protein n=1 Tax=Methylomonas defluvii TaxID=3045149 RepID=A0ABU4UBC3_9GAMM|nr:hypothetical protein [Methylomonas sp. OY6]MDX8126754.1 hypothetical protein [Methylomonas sp. OY6]